MEIVILNNKQVDYLWREISKRQILFHPDKQPSGDLQSRDFFLPFNQENRSIILDRNLLSALLDFCRNGHLESEAMRTNIALIMFWATFNGVSISSGLAIEEVITQGCDSSKAERELQDFFKIIETYPVQTWIGIAMNQINSITALSISKSNKEL